MPDSVFPDVSKLNYLTNRCGDGGPLTHLLDYNGVRYHLHVDYNFENPDCLENEYLQKVYDACMQDDDDFYQDCVYDCMDMFWSFLKEADTARKRKRKPNDAPSQAEEPTIVKLGVETIDGRLQAFEHQEHFKYPRTEPVPNSFPSLTLFSKAEIEHLADIDYNIHKVRIRGTEYCNKTVHRSTESSFVREIEKLTRIPQGHPNIISLIGVVDAGEGTIDGMVLGLISGNPLSEVQSLSTSQKEKWKRQISETISFLYGIGVIWEDVKPANILIDEKTDDAVLIDFGGGSTKGWVDHHLTGTTQGDLQGLDRITKYLDNLNVTK